jgi:LPXTG-site transpeptidase (sortase) family protein
MPSMTRRRFVLLSTVALLGAACGAPAEAGLRGSGTVLMPREADTSPTRVAAVEPTPTLRAIPTLPPAPTPAPEPIVSSDMLPTLVGGSTDAEMHVLPVLSGKPPIAPTLPARRIIIPTLGLDSKVIQLGTKLDRKGQLAWETAPFAVGQHKGLAGPGQNGNMVLSGHISSPNEGAIFHHLPDLKVGEGVIVSTEERQYLYRVTDVQTVTPDKVEVLNQTSDATATLITCVPDGIYSHRLVVTARLV